MKLLELALRVCSKINSDFAGGRLAVWLGVSDEHTRQRSVRSEQRRQTAKQPQPSGAGRRRAICFVARRSQPTGGDAPSSRLASGQAALPPKSEVIFEQTLKVHSGLERWRELQSLDVQVSPMGRIHIARERGRSQSATPK